MRPYCILIFLLSLGLFSQELPPIQTFSTAQYNGENQNWSVSQSSNKFIYIANNHSLLEYDGDHWKKYGSPNGSTIRNVSIIDDKIYIGCYMEFGFWQKNSKGELIYTSLVEKLEKPLLEDEEFWNIMRIEDQIIFQSLNRIYMYSIKDEGFRIIEANTDKATIFHLNSGIYFQIKNKGLYRLTEDDPELVTADPLIKDRSLIGMYSHNEELILLSSDATFFKLKNNSIENWNIPGQSFINSKTLYSFHQLKDESIALGTISNGLYQFSANGELIQHFNQQKGLNNNTILTIFQDRDSNVWLGHDNGLSVINLESQFGELVDKLGNLGVVYTATMYKGTLYLGTNQGLFVSENDGNNIFKLIEGTKGQVWCLKQLKDRLFCGHHNGTYLIEGQNAILISDFPGTWDIKPIKDEPNLLLQGNYDGLSVLENINNAWSFRNSLSGFDISSRFFEFSNNGDIFVNHEYKGVFRLRPDDQYSKIEVISREEGKGPASSLVKFRNEMLYATVHGVFKLNSEKTSFVVDTTLTNLFQYEDRSSLSILMNDGSDNSLFRFGKEDIIYLESSIFGKGYNRTVISIPASLRNSLGVAGFENVTNIEDKKFLIGSSNGFITLDLEKLKARDYTIYLNKIRNYSFDNPEQTIELDSIVEFENSENNLQFSFSIPVYDKYAIAEYQYKLEGYYDKWSSWTTDGEVAFENLPAGDYQFILKGRVGNTFTDNSVSYAFSIKKPWYLSDAFVVMYALLAMGLAFIIHRIYMSYYRKQQRKIIIENKRENKRKKNKAKRKIIQIKNEKLEQEIESKNRELAVSTMSLIKKNEFLNSIKDRLNALEKTQQIKSIVKMIDKNITNEEDWKFFEEAFNNADKDFLKKMKTTYPLLTPNDLKLCAYLRLNLSSKEIAPLLNISTRSVEIKRYRLRKKMDLDKGSSLVEHILSI